MDSFNLKHLQLPVVSTLVCTLSILQVSDCYRVSKEQLYEHDITLSLSSSDKSLITLTTHSS